MPKGYWIGQVTIIQPEPYSEYAKAAKIAVKKYGGRYMIRAGAHVAFEGEWKPRHVMIEFDSYQTALDCYNSPEYQSAKAMRLAAAAADLLVIEGSDEELASKT